MYKLTVEYLLILLNSNGYISKFFLSMSICVTLVSFFEYYMLRQWQSLARDSSGPSIIVLNSYSCI